VKNPGDYIGLCWFFFCWKSGVYHPSGSEKLVVAGGYIMGWLAEGVKTKN
jgi:hypothetical protein